MNGWHVGRTWCGYEQWQYQALTATGLEVGRCWVLTRPGEPAHFSGLYVELAWRGQGIARALLTQVLADCAATGVTCHASPFDHTQGLSRRALVAFYRSHGATVTRTGRCTWAAPHGGNHAEKPTTG